MAGQTECGLGSCRSKTGFGEGLQPSLIVSFGGTSGSTGYSLLLKAILSLYNQSESLVCIADSKSLKTHLQSLTGLPFVTFFDKISRHSQGSEGVLFSLGMSAYTVAPMGPNPNKRQKIDGWMHTLLLLLLLLIIKNRCQALRKLKCSSKWCSRNPHRLARMDERVVFVAWQQLS